MTSLEKKTILTSENLPQISGLQWLDYIMKLSKLNATAHNFAPFHLTSPKSNYNVIFVQDLLRKLGIN